MGLGLPMAWAGNNDQSASPRCQVFHLLCPGPTVLEMFNTLLRPLRLSIDYPAHNGENYDGAISLGTKIIKEHEERMFQEAVIKTIGGPGRHCRPPGRAAGPDLPAVGGVDGRSPFPQEMLVPGFVGLSSTQHRVGAPW